MRVRHLPSECGVREDVDRPRPMVERDLALCDVSCELIQFVAEVLGIDLDLCTRCGQQFGFPRCCFRTTSEDDPSTG